MIVIIDYKTGNLTSIRNMIKKIGHNAVISSDPDVICKAEKLILPGVGHFDFGMRNLRELGLIPVLNNKVLVERKPILGICLGAQLFTKGSDEGRESGLGWINGFTRSFDTTKLVNGLKIPHMGWSDVRYSQHSRLFAEFSELPRFYFVHSYHLVCESSEVELAYGTHGYEFVAAVEDRDIVGVQFHPEKSHRFGMQLLGNFIRNY